MSVLRAIDPVVALVLRGALALLFLVAAFHKLRRPLRFAATLREYHVLPGAAAPVAAGLVIGGEVTLVFGLLAGRPFAPLAVAALLVVYAAAIAVNLARGRRHLDCGCAGPGARRPIGGWLVARNLAVALVALGGLLPVAPRELMWVDACTVVAATAALAAAWAAGDRLLALGPALAELRAATARPEVA